MKFIRTLISFYRLFSMTNDYRNDISIEDRQKIKQALSQISPELNKALEVLTSRIWIKIAEWELNQEVWKWALYAIKLIYTYLK